MREDVDGSRLPRLCACYFLRRRRADLSASQGMRPHSAVYRFFIGGVRGLYGGSGSARSRGGERGHLLQKRGMVTDWDVRFPPITDVRANVGFDPL